METTTQKVHLNLPKPHSPKQELIMRSLSVPHVKETVVCCGTKYGKSSGATPAVIHPAVRMPGSKWRWIAPIYRQAKVGVEYFNKMLPPPPYAEIVESKMIARIPSIDTSIEFWHAQNPVDLEGAGVHGQVFDEAAKMHEQAYLSGKTTQTFTRGPSLLISTPYGKNWFHKRFMFAKERMEWAIKNGKDPEYLAIHAPTTANPYILKEVIEDARKLMPDRLFRQYYLAEFVDEGSVFIGHHQCVVGAELVDVEGAHQFWIADTAKERDVVIGVDWAKKKDFTVFVALDYTKRPFKTVGFMRFQNLKYTDAVKELYMFTKHFKKVDLVMHDKTGVGEAIDDMLSNLPMNFNGLTFSNPAKANIVNKLGLAFEKADIELPFWNEMLKEFDSFEVEISETGTMTYNAPEGMHDDIVMAFCLANSAALEYCGSSFEIQFVEDLPKKELTLDRFYKDLMADEGPF